MPPAMIEPSLEKWRDIINEQLQQETGTVFDLTSLIHNIFASLKSSSFPTAVAHNISQQCLEDSQLYVHNLYRNQSLWSLQSKSIFLNVIIYRKAISNNIKQTKDNQKKPP